MNRYHHWTVKEHEFMNQYVPGHTHNEIQQEFIKQFGWDISLSQIRGYLKNHKLKTGKTGRFVKGQVSYNKGRKGVYYPGCEKSWFKKGHVPDNYKPVGTEIVTCDGYIKVKIAAPDKWELKHRLVWQSVHGEIPKDCAVIFKDGNKKNINIDNLLLVKKSVLAILNKTKLGTYNGEFKDTAVAIAELHLLTSQKQRGLYEESKKETKKN